MTWPGLGGLGTLHSGIREIRSTLDLYWPEISMK
jgi:hypothetical protein